MNNKQKELLLKNMSNDHAKKVSDMILARSNIKSDDHRYKVTVKAKDNGRRNDS